METSEWASETILGTDAIWQATSISTPLPNGIVIADGDAMVTTIEGDVVRIKKSGIGWLDKKGRKTRRGVLFHITQSEKLARLNKVVGLWEFESEEWKLVCQNMGMEIDS